MRKFVITMLKIRNYVLTCNYDLKNLSYTLLLDGVVLIYNADSTPLTPPLAFTHTTPPLFILPSDSVP
jgi:hypothetical protein